VASAVRRKGCEVSAGGWSPRYPSLANGARGFDTARRLSQPQGGTTRQNPNTGSGHDFTTERAASALRISVLLPRTSRGKAAPFAWSSATRAGP
jgi:hypothetical protein